MNVLRGPQMPAFASISAVSQRLGLTARAIRYYEDQGLLSPQRDRFGCRRFSRADQQKLELIAALRSADIPIRTIERLVALFEAGDRFEFARVARRKLEARLQEIDRKRVAVEQLSLDLNDMLGLREAG